MNHHIFMAEARQQAKIFIVDDHPIIRGALTHLINLEEDMVVVGEAESAAEAVEKIDKLNPDLAIVDISLNGPNGLALTKTLTSTNPKIAVLIMSMHDESLYGERALRAGARGYLMKHEPSEKIITAIRKVLAGNIYVSAQMHNLMMDQFSGRGAALPGSYSHRLSNRELEVLYLTGQGYSTRHCAEELHVSVKTIESHYTNIKNKLGLKNAHELIQYAVKTYLSEQ